MLELIFDGDLSTFFMMFYVTIHSGLETKKLNYENTGYLFYLFLFQILKTYIHAALHARWVLRCLKTAKYVQINETDKYLIHSKTRAKIINKTNNIPLTVVSNHPLRLDMLSILSISKEAVQSFQESAVKRLTQRTVA